MKPSPVMALTLTLAALALRLAMALCVVEDTSGDGPLYQALGLNVLNHRSYSIESEPPFSPTLIRVPGYPLVLATVFWLAGERNAEAVHVVQAIADTGTCWVLALLCSLLVPVEWDVLKRRRAALLAFSLAAICPFTIAYTGTMLTETWALLFGTACLTLGTWSLEGEGSSTARWVLTGLAGGAGCLFRPDLGLFLAALGALLVFRWIAGARSALAAARQWRAVAPATRQFVASGLALSLSFVAVLLPWTLRNAVQFAVFEPLAPATATMPGEFVPRGYMRWLGSWITEPRHVPLFWWGIDERAIDPAIVPEAAVDSPGERASLTSLLDRYNRGPKDKELLPGEETGVSMTPALDAEFGAIANERIRQHPFRHYLVLPMRRAWNLWFDSHSDYYPFDGDLFPANHRDLQPGQATPLALFYALTWLYTLLGLGGVLALWRSAGCRRWLLLLSLVFLPRVAFFASLPNPEPRYMVELFPLVSVLGSIALASWREIPARSS